MNNRTRRAGSAVGPIAVALLMVCAGVDRGRCATPDDHKSRMLKVCAGQGYRFTPTVRRAFLACAKSQARAELKARGKALPKEFLAWIDANPEVEASVYAAHDKPADVLLHLYALRLDLGRVRFERYHQLALAGAIVHAKQAAQADITPRKPLYTVWTMLPKAA